MVWNVCYYIKYDTIGQLDGGHISYAMFGPEKQVKIAKVFWWFMLTIGVCSILGIIHSLLAEDSTSGIYNS